MLALKIEAQRLAGHCRTRALLFAYLSILSGAAGTLCGILCLCCAVLGTDRSFSGFLSAAVFVRFPWIRFVIPSVCALLCPLFRVSEACFSSAYRALFFAAASDQKPAFRQLLSLKNGLRSIIYRHTRRLIFAGEFLRCFAPFFVGLIFIAALLLSVGLPKGLLAFCLLLPGLQLPLCTAAFYARSRQYVLAPYLMYLYPRLPAREALISSALFAEGNLKKIAVTWLRLSGWRLFSVLLLPLPFTLWYLPAVETALCSELYRSGKSPEIRSFFP